MHFAEPLRFGVLRQRYKRFLVDVVLDDGYGLTAHCPNTGSMRGCSAPGSRVALSRSANPGRKYPWTLELVESGGVWVGVNTSRSNRLVREALEDGVIPDFGWIKEIVPEVRVGGSTRLDFLLRSSQGKTYVEVKNCSLAEGGVALFPDAVTARGTRHLLELARLREQGNGAAILFCIQRGDAEIFRPADAIDPLYAKTLREVVRRGVGIMAWRARTTPQEIRLERRIRVELHAMEDMQS